jgi:hypothetical protein
MQKTFIACKIFVGYEVLSGWPQRVLSSVLYLHVVCWKSTDVSEEHIACIVRANE